MAVVASGCSGIQVRSNVVGAGVHVDGKRMVEAVTPGELKVNTDRPHLLTFSAPGYEESSMTITPRCSHLRAAAMIALDIISIPAITGVFFLVTDIRRMSTEPYYPGVYDEDEVFVQLKPKQDSPGQSPSPSTSTDRPVPPPNEADAAADTKPIADLKAASSARATQPPSTTAPSAATEPKKPLTSDAPSSATNPSDLPKPRFCGQCGARFEGDGKFCAECGAKR
jgi:hypothetical protein